jgi:hypothetical protein
MAIFQLSVFLDQLCKPQVTGYLTSSTSCAIHWEGESEQRDLCNLPKKFSILANQNRAKKEKRILPIAFDCPANLDAQITVPLHTGSSYETSIMQGLVVSTLMK